MYIRKLYCLATYESHKFILCGKEQLIYDLPTRLGKCISSESYADAVRLYTGAMPIFEVNSFTCPATNSSLFFFRNTNSSKRLPSLFF